MSAVAILLAGLAPLQARSDDSPAKDTTTPGHVSHAKASPKRKPLPKRTKASSKQLVASPTDARPDQVVASPSGASTLSGPGTGTGAVSPPGQGLISPPNAGGFIPTGSNIAARAASYGNPNPPIGQFGPPRVGLFTATGNQLLRDGIEIHGIVLDRYLLDNTAGPHPHQQGNISAIAPAADFDLEKLLGIRGGVFHSQVSVQFLRVNEPNLADTAGGWLTGWQTTPALPGLWFYPSYLTYEQRLFQNKLSIEFGRTNFFRYFFQSNALDPFFNISAVAQVVGDSSSVPFPTWGARMIYHYTPKDWVQIAAFADNDYEADDVPFTVGESRATGAAVFAEVGSRTEFFNAAYPRNYELGVEFSTRKGFSLTKGSPLPAVPAFSAADYPGGGFFFLHGLQTLWRGARKVDGPPANIALYGSVDPSYDKPQPFDVDAILGLNFTGFIPGRPYDAVGLQGHYLRLSKVEQVFESRFHNIFAGPGPDQPRNNLAFDATYNLSFNNIVSLKPSLQYFVNPDNYGDPTFNKRPGDGFEISALLVISLGRLFGTSAKPF